MKPVLRLASLVALVAATLAVIWVVGQRPTVQQSPSLSPVLDRATEAKAAVNRVGQELTKVSLQEEVNLGARLVEQEWGQGLPRSSPGRFTPQQLFLDGILVRLTAKGGLRRPEMPYRIQILDQGAVNAFAMPGGRLYMTSAMLEFVESEAEVAAILAHEMAHVDLRHCIERYQYELRARKVGGATLEAMASLGTRLMLQGYQDEQEGEADRWGMQLLERAGYHPQAPQRVLARLEGRAGAGQTPRTVPGEASHALLDALEDYFASHPRGAQRIADLDRAMGDTGIAPEGRRYYLGVRNRKGWVPWTRQEFPEEWIQRRLDP